MKYDLYIMDGPNEGCFLKDISLKAAALLLDVDESEVTWAIEEFGRCDSYFLGADVLPLHGAVVVPHGNKKPRSWEDRDHPLFDVCPNDNTVS